MAAGPVLQSSEKLEAVGSPTESTWRKGSEWIWNGHKVRYSVVGADKPGTPCEYPDTIAHLLAVSD